jgi:Sugar (and other) transporter
VLITFVGGMCLDWSHLALLLLALVPPAQLIFWTLPESPSFLASAGRQAAMEAALKQLGRGEEAPYYIELLENAALHKKQQDAESAASSSADRTWCPPSWLPARRSTWQPLLISLALMFFSQATGFNTVLGYAKLIFIEAHLGSIHEDEAMGITAGILLLSCGFAIGLSKVAPRRVLLLASASACCLTLTLLGLYYYLKEIRNETVQSFAWLPLGALLVLIVSHMAGYGAVAWTVIVEILPGPVRSALFPLVVAFNCVCNFGFALSFSRIENMAGYHVVFWLHAALTALGAVVVFAFVPETRDKTEQEIARFFTRDDSASVADLAAYCGGSTEDCSNTSSSSSCDSSSSIDDTSLAEDKDNVSANDSISFHNDNRMTMTTSTATIK